MYFNNKTVKTLVLKNKKEFFVFPTVPFHFDGTFHKPSHFPNKLKMEEWEPTCPPAVFTYFSSKCLVM